MRLSMRRGRWRWAIKRGIAEHPKTEDLAERLEIPVGFAVGILEMLAHWTAKNAIRGDVGRWTDQQIARGIRCGVATDLLLAALIESRWLDRHPTHRLVVHDWHDHADESVRKTLKKRGWTFANLDPSTTPPSPIHPNPEECATVLEESRSDREESDQNRPASGSGKGKGSGNGSGSSDSAGEDTARAREAPSVGGCTRCHAPPSVPPDTLNAIRRQFPRTHPMQLEYVARWVLQRQSEPDTLELARTLEDLKRLHPTHEIQAHFARLTDPEMPAEQQRYHTLKTLRTGFALYGPSFNPRGDTPNGRGARTGNTTDDRGKWASEAQRPGRSDRLRSGSGTDPEESGAADAVGTG